MTFSNSQQNSIKGKKVAFFYRFNAKNWRFSVWILFSKNFARVKKMTNIRYGWLFHAEKIDISWKDEYHDKMIIKKKIDIMIRWISWNRFGPDLTCAPVECGPPEELLHGKLYRFHLISTTLSLRTAEMVEEIGVPFFSTGVKNR